MICPNCQREVPDTAKACGYCGQWLIDEGEESTVKLPEDRTTVGAAQAGGRSPWLGIGIGIGVLALVLLVGLLAFLVGRGGGAVDTEATVAAAVAATQQAAAVGAGTTETTTPEPPTVPTDTPQPEPGDTPAPEATHTREPTQAPPPAPDGEVPLYDDFNDSDLDGSYNQGLWIRPDETVGTLTQQDGLLVAEQGRGEPTSITLLAAREYDFVPIEEPFSFQVRLLLDSDPGGGSVFLAFSAELADGEGWWTDCSVYVDSVGCWADPDSHLFGKDAGPDTWHTLRIDIEPDPMTFYYSIDGQLVNTIEPLNAEALKTARFAPKIGVYSEDGEPVVGYIDEVRIGQTGQ